ncbi:BadF/BadG/BcrA/BcrD ATPase family protein [Cryobacterium sp. PH31-AA6]|uniref:N-acetylglucosamine kinase n=1 Tax=Cryobacterium sp. PH31-AA6 TaxID=3046205 RepID=UPI0024BBCDB6|nr:BadF/BadG/BcrA/BcrD ATPase family protein [Cryobacterium sp. PH31-AA6]MDJ0322339.1 BadF/BadG/BcrA/BcrD ATPase family protein [Cryobacterium sp. PH31-AA6]
MTDHHRSLSIDAGQTGIRALLRGGDTADETFGFDGILTDTDLIPQLVDVVARVAGSSGMAIHTVSAGISGFTYSPADADELRAATDALGVREVRLAHDSVTSYLGALGDSLGAVIAVGTGVVTLAVGEAAVRRIDGWGNLIGDAGSGYWIGRAGLDAAMRDYDGRGPHSALTDAVRADFPNLETAYLELQGDPGRVSRIAGYSRHVTALAPTDAVAAGICAAAAAELVLSVAAGLHGVGEGSGPAPVVCGLGGVLRAEEINVPFEQGLRALWPAIDIRPPQASSLEGAALLPVLSARSALRDRVAVSVGVAEGE